jgi:hypothetical protein
MRYVLIAALLVACSPAGTPISSDANVDAATVTEAGTWTPCPQCSPTCDSSISGVVDCLDVHGNPCLSADGSDFCVAACTDGEINAQGLECDMTTPRCHTSRSASVSCFWMAP